MKDKLRKLFKESLEWDFDGSQWISEKNFAESIKEFEKQLNLIIDENN